MEFNFLLAVVVAAGFVWLKLQKSQSIKSHANSGDIPHSMYMPDSERKKTEFWDTVDSILRRLACGDDNAWSELTACLKEFVKVNGLDDDQASNLDEERLNRQLEIFRQEADKGNAIAQCKYAKFVASSPSLPGYKDIDLRYTWMSVEQGCTEAMIHLGNIIEFDQGNVDIAKNWYQTAADQGNPEAFAELGRLAGYKSDYYAAFEWYDKAVNALPKELKILVAGANIRARYLFDKQTDDALGPECEKSIKRRPNIDDLTVAKQAVELFERSLALVPDESDDDLQRRYGRESCLGLADIYECAGLSQKTREKTPYYDPKKAFHYLVQAEIYSDSKDDFPRKRMKRIYEETGICLTDEEWHASEQEFEKRHGCSLHSNDISE